MNTFYLALFIAVAAAAPSPDGLGLVSSHVDENGKKHEIYAYCDSPAYGGNGGDQFDERGDHEAYGALTQINLRTGNRVDMIQTRYGNTLSTARGGGGGDLVNIPVTAGNGIVRVSGRSGSRVDQLQFRFRDGTSTNAYGGGGGDPFETAACATCELAYIRGRSGRELDQLVFVFDC